MYSISNVIRIILYLQLLSRDKHVNGVCGHVTSIGLGLWSGEIWCAYGL